MPRARQAVCEFAEAYGIDREPLGLAVSEAATNVVRHAYRDQQPGEIAISAEHADRELVVEVADTGVGIRPHPGWDGLGLGLPLIARMSERMELKTSGGGMVLSMSFVRRR